MITSVEDLVQFHEGRRSQAYDDADGSPLHSGMTIRGHATVGIGHNLEVPMCDAAIDAQYAFDLAQASSIVSRLVPTAGTMDQVRHAALVDCAFNMGEHTFSQFTTFLSLMDSRQYEAAAEDLLNTKVDAELPKRYGMLAQMIQTGNWPVA